MTAFFHQSRSLAAVAVFVPTFWFAGTLCPAIAVAPTNIKVTRHVSIVFRTQLPLSLRSCCRTFDARRQSSPISC
jgi:hypothetical protein